jgi:hypothetical protein
MFKKITRFATNFASLMSDTNTIIDVDGRFANIQRSMLESLMEHMSYEQARPKVYADIKKAIEVQTLWYLRSDLFAKLAEFSGEDVAQKRLNVITEMFRGAIPDNQMPKIRR